MRVPIIAESDWLDAVNPMNMLRFLGEKASERKSNLLAAASFRRIWHLLATKRGWKAVEVLEQYVEGEATTEQLARPKKMHGNQQWRYPIPKATGCQSMRLLLLLVCTIPPKK